MPSAADNDKVELRLQQELAAQVIDRAQPQSCNIMCKSSPIFTLRNSHDVFVMHLVLTTSCLQIQQAHDFLSELEIKPAFTSASPNAPELKAKRRNMQVLYRTNDPCDQLGSGLDAELPPDGAVQPKSGGAAAVDFSDVSLDWGLGKLVSNRLRFHFSVQNLNVLLSFRTDAQIFQIFPAAFYR